jgi:peptidoglycan/LPS O-acetylase OafA/YrhL
MIEDSSYSLYLTHGILAYVHAGLLKRGWFAGPHMQNLALVPWRLTAVAFGWIFYALVERPLTRTLKRPPAAITSENTVSRSPSALP